MTKEWRFGMTQNNPAVSIGVPVFNGAAFIAQALDSLLAQSFQDFEIIISDNASTDETQSIAQDYAMRYPCIKYMRQEGNLGASHNFNTVFRHSRGRYFKWHAHDDLLDPRFLEKTVTKLDQQDDAALCYSQIKWIDIEGDPLELEHFWANSFDPAPVRRFHNLLHYKGQHFYEIYGLIRAEALEHIELFSPRADTERLILAQLALHGPFVQVEDALFLSRIHPGQAQWQCLDASSRRAWLIGASEAAKAPMWQTWREAQRSLRRAPLSWKDKVQSQSQMLRYFQQGQG
jgi:glycosyltransferase involved in cell wall biosynthesis